MAAPAGFTPPPSVINTTVRSHQADEVCDGSVLQRLKELLSDPAMSIGVDGMAGRRLSGADRVLRDARVVAYRSRATVRRAGNLVVEDIEDIV